MDNSRLIGAVVLAAGRSSRMGQPKMVLPWGETTVIGQVVAILTTCDVAPIVVVTGGAADLVELALNGTSAVSIRNPDFAVSEMLLSIQIGLSAMPAGVQACLVCLGDQPQIEASVVVRLIQRYQQTVRVGWQINPCHILLFVQQSIDEAGILVGKTVVLLTPER